ncbi:MAG: M48 family metalloprotease [Pseudomonadota bacterium]
MRLTKILRGLLAGGVTLVVLCGCVVNPVTGKNEISLIPAAQELAIGEQNYLPMQQSQGGVQALDPALNAYVSDIGQKIAAVSDRDLPYEFVVLNNSVPNAWALPGGKIAINRGLLTEMRSEAELASVLGHEVIHAAAKHSARQMQRGMLLQALVIGTAVVTNDSDYGALAAGAANIGAQLLTQAYSREAEREADAYGIDYMVRAGYNPQGAVDLQRTFLRLAQEAGRSQGPSLTASHPPSSERLALNEAKAQSLGKNGFTGNDTFAAAMRTLSAAQPAFDAYDAGRKALANGDARTAATKAREAIRREPREASFYGLLGDAAVVDKKLGDAVTHYSKALERDRNFFYYFLQRGLAREQLGYLDVAESDLVTSLQLFETAPAYNGLGKIAERQGNTERAKELYARAGNSDTQAGNAARSALLRLDLPDNPSRYLRARTALDSQGQLLIAVDNPNAQTIGSVVVRIRYIDSEGRTRQIERRVPSAIAAGTSRTLATGLGPFANTNQYAVSVVGARLTN